MHASCGQPYFTHPVPGCNSHFVGMTVLAGMHTVYKLRVSVLSVQLLAEVNGPAKADKSKIIMMNINIFGRILLFFTFEVRLKNNRG